MTELAFVDGLAVLEARARRAKIAIWAMIAISICTAIGQFLESAGIVDLASAVINGPTLIVAFAYMGFGLSYLVSVVFVAMWIHRAHANLFAAGLHDLEYTPGWSVGWFFIPFANLIKPFQAMRELWNASYGADNSFGSETPSAVGSWWACFIAGNILLNIGSRLEGPETGTGGAAIGTIVSGVAILVTVGSAWFLLKIIGEVMEGQRNHLQVSEAFA
ncbi:MAG: DUF4328 domain-containing protein [Candidatus Andeanibacterium colombiense]|uniref:DUF4328 domain-containing protein n=1 Tax=Candidatus Andeanibacterium colombiense TaxID=3121345 RepID=A0AAJ5X618_9SPHN|nr:MAG: DUF4328 domain-containing protein [Sphingomonadaceae bacterium]